MPKTMPELREQLSAIEPEERTYQGIGPTEIGFLTALLNDDEAWLAARAVHALSRIDADAARNAIVLAARSPRLEIRVAAAVSAQSLPPRLSDQVLDRLLSDSQAAVRKFAIRSVSSSNSPVTRQRIREIATTEADTLLRQIAQEKTRAVPPA